MQGFIGFSIPLWMRRVLTMIPAFVVIALGVRATEAMVLSQVVLSLTLPAPMIVLVMFTRRPDIMGEFANCRAVNIAVSIATALVLALNALLIAQAASF